jgi:hypothetical protein
MPYRQHLENSTMGDNQAAHELRLTTHLRENPVLQIVFQRWNGIGLPEAWVGAGCVAQTVWNLLAGNPPASHIRDMDLVYFDPDDLSAETEALHQQRLRILFSDLGIPVDVKNQARVHLWYQQRFGKPIAAFTGIPDAVRTWPTPATSIAVRPQVKTPIAQRLPANAEAQGTPPLDVCAPFGLEDLLAGIVRPNKVLIDETVYLAKTERWRACWPTLRILAW